MESGQAGACKSNRRDAFRAMLGAAAVGAGAMLIERRASAQSIGDIDLLNLMLNCEYLMTQFLGTSAAIAIDPTRLTGNGVAGTPPIAGRKVTFTDPQLGAIVTEMANDNHNHLNSMRTVIGALATGQPLMDISASATAPFSVAMQSAGVIAAGAAFDPYASEENFLYAAFLLKSMSVAAYRGLAASTTNRVVTQNFTGLLGAESIHAATIRSYLYSRGATTQRLRDNADKIAAFQRTLNGGSIFTGISPVTRTYAGGTVTVRAARISPAAADGQVPGLTSGRLLNQLYLTATATTSGGFFPQGVGGNIRTSASA